MTGRTTAVWGLLAVACAFDSAGVGSGDAAGSETGSTATTSATTTSATTTATTTGAGTTGDPTTLDVTGDPMTSSSGGPGPGTSSSGADASSDGGDASSSGGETPPPFGPFGEPVPVPELNSAEFDDDPTLRADLREIYFASTRPLGQGAEEIWRAERASVDDVWDPPELVTALNSPGMDGWPDLSHDGLVLTFASDRVAQAAFDVYLVTRDDVDAAWSPPMLVAELDVGTPIGGAVLSADNLEMFVTTALASGVDDIARTTRDSMMEPFGAPEPVAELNSGDRDTVPFLDVDGTRLLFASNRPGTAGTMDIWTAVREPGMPFDDAVQVDGVNGDFADDDPWWAPDGSVLYMARSGADGVLDIYVAPVMR